jgi:hypothetical protein
VSCCSELGATGRRRVWNVAKRLFLCSCVIHTTLELIALLGALWYFAVPQTLWATVMGWLQWL